MTEHFRIEDVSGCKVVHCLVDLNEMAFPELLGLIADLDKSAPIILDFENRHTDDLKFFRAITPFGLQLKKASKKLYVVRARLDFETVVRERGLNEIISVYPLVSDFLHAIRSNAGKSNKNTEKTDAVFLNSFINATIKTLQVQCNVTIAPKQPCNKGGIPEISYDIAGVIGLTSKGFRGSIAICYPKETFLALIGSMLGETYSEITKDLEDGAAELLNMIFGQAKADLNHKNYEIEKAIPAVIRGEALRMNHLGSSPTIVIPFESSMGVLRIEINVENQETRRAA
jgi:chemotaxis protein CheX